MRRIILRAMGLSGLNHATVGSRCIAYSTTIIGARPRLSSAGHRISAQVYCAYECHVVTPAAGASIVTRVMTERSFFDTNVLVYANGKAMSDSIQVNTFRLCQPHCKNAGGLWESRK
jgi:hypothetical protein